MKRLTSWCLSVAAVLLFAGMTQAQDAKKADPVGTWTWTMQARGGGGGEGQPREVTMKIAKEGDKLAGTISGRQNETKLQNVKLEGDELSFDYTRETQNGNFTQKYKGKVAGDTITGKITSERDGQTRERDWTAKRKTDATKEEKK